MLVVVVDTSDEGHDRSDAEEIVGVGEEPHPGDDDGLEMVQLGFGSVESGKHFESHG